jgi:hypothetical protein
MRRHIKARVVGSNREINLRPDVMMLSVSKTGAAKEECFLCTAPTPCLDHADHAHRAACDAYLGGFVNGVAAMIDGRRPPLCDAHETQLREMLVVLQDAEVFKKLGIEYQRAGDQK